MADILRLVDRDDDDVIHVDLWDLTGANNPEGLRIHPESIDWGEAQFEDKLFHHPRGGARRVYSRPLPTEGTWLLNIAADSWDELDAGMAAVRAAFRDLEEKAILWQPEDQTDPEHVDLISVTVPPSLRGQGHDLETRTLRDLEDLRIPISFLRQPWFRGADIVIAAAAVPNNPASANGRVYRVTNPAEAPSPGIVKITADAGSKLQEVKLGLLSGDDALLDDYETETKFAQAEASGGGWTVEHFNGTVSVVDASGSGGNAAQSPYPANPTVMQKQIRIERATKLDSLRGEWDAYARLRAGVADEHVLLPRWGPSLADLPVNVLPEVIFEHSDSTSFVPHDIKLGRIEIPDDIPLGGFAFELWSRSEDVAARLLTDFIFLMPANASTISVPGSSSQTWLGSQLVQPTSPAGLGAGTVSGSDLLLNDLNDAGGTPPNAGLVLGAGRHRVIFDVTVSKDDAVEIRIRNVTDGSNLYTLALGPVTNQARYTRQVEFDLPTGAHAAADAFQFQVVATDEAGAPGLPSKAHSIEHDFIPYIVAGEAVRTDPERNAVEKVDAAGNLLQDDLKLAGAVPMEFPPGQSTLVLIPFDVKPDSNAPGLESVLGRTPTLQVTLSPRNPK